MKATGFDPNGPSRSYWDFFFGYGLFIGITFAVQGVLFWQFSRLIQADGVRIRPMLTVFCAGYLATSVVSAMYFFFVPAVLQLLIAACLAVAVIGSRRLEN